jgi:hypothetical protein
LRWRTAAGACLSLCSIESHSATQLLADFCFVKHGPLVEACPQDQNSILKLTNIARSTGGGDALDARAVAVVVGALWIGFHAATAGAQAVQALAPPATRAAWGAKEGEACIGCHGPMNPALTEEWRAGAHGQKGVNCFDCDRAEPGEADAFEHNGALITVIISPKDCARCHQKEVDEQKGSHHAKAGQILASLDNFLGEVVGGPPAVAAGCFQCHGSTIKVLPGGKFDPAT